MEPLCFGFPPILGVFIESAFAQGGGPQGTYVEAQFDDTILRNSVGNLFSFAEGAVAGILIIFFGIVAVTCFVRKRRKLGFAFSGAALLLFAFRMFVWWLFGPPFQDYEG